MIPQHKPSYRFIPLKCVIIQIIPIGKGWNKKFRHQFGFKARMLAPEEVLEQTGHAIGGVCPFGLNHILDIYLDVSMLRFETLYPACGSSNSAIELTKDEVFKYSFAKEWIDVCKIGSTVTKVAPYASIE